MTATARLLAAAIGFALVALLAVPIVLWSNPHVG